jgi:hypothetical protein
MFERNFKSFFLFKFLASYRMYYASYLIPFYFSILKKNKKEEAFSFFICSSVGLEG